MRTPVWLKTALLSGACLALVTFPGCGGSSENQEVKNAKPRAGKEKSPSGSGGGESTGTSNKGGPKKDYKVAGYAPSLKGRVTYNGDGKPEVKMLKPVKDETKCPPEVPAEGWYVKEDNKGVKYAMVFLKPPKDGRMPKPGPNAEKPAKEVIEMAQPKCQFEPRVIALHPAQKLVFINDSMPGIAHDSNLKGKTDFGKTLNPGEKTAPIDPDPDDGNPYKVSCNIHQGTMSAYVWRPSHPYAVVTDEDGNFELKDVPVLEGWKMILALWHETLPADSRNVKEIGDLDLKVDEPATKDIAITK